MKTLTLRTAAEDSAQVVAVVFDNGNVATDSGRYFFNPTSFQAWAETERLVVDATDDEVEAAISG